MKNVNTNPQPLRMQWEEKECVSIFYTKLLVGFLLRSLLRSLLRFVWVCISWHDCFGCDCIGIVCQLSWLWLYSGCDCIRVALIFRLWLYWWLLYWGLLYRVCHCIRDGIVFGMGLLYRVWQLYWAWTIVLGFEYWKWPISLFSNGSGRLSANWVWLYDCPLHANWVGIGVVQNWCCPLFGLRVWLWRLTLNCLWLLGLYKWFIILKSSCHALK